MTDDIQGHPRIITFQCIVCGAREHQTYSVPDNNKFPDVTIRLVRCPICTAENIPLPKSRGKK